MIEDKEINIVYLSKWLKENHIDFYLRLTALFKSLYQIRDSEIQE